MDSLEIYDLRTEYRTEPLGLDTDHPRFTWRLRGDAGAVHSGRVIVSSPAGMLWDSGPVSPAARVSYPGDLDPATRYDVEVRLEGASGDLVANCSSWFETGLGVGSRRTFAGEWIAVDRTIRTADGGMEPPSDVDIPRSMQQVAPVGHFRRSFRAAAVTRARIYATAHGIYTVHLNGRRLGKQELAPGWTDYAHRLQYQTYDVTAEILAGDNVVGLQLADGWWSGYVGFDRRRQGNHYGTDTEVWAQIELDYSDGSHERITTDGEWMWSHGAVVYTDLLMGEHVDARRSLGEWTDPGYDASSWHPVATAPVDFAPFVGEIDDPIVVRDEVVARSVVIDAHGRALYDFGQNLVGRVRIELGEQAPGSAIVLRHGETLENGELYTANLRTAEQRDVFVSAGAASRFEPTFTLHGFRYLEVSGLDAPVPVEKVTAVVLGNAIPPAGRISTSSPDVNQLISNISWGQLGNFVGLPTDCPQRDERLGWMADAQVFLPTAALNADVAAFFTRWLADVRGAQSDEGSFPDIAPVISNAFVDGAPAWADGGVIIPWHLYRIYGDLRLLETSFDSMRRWVDFVERHNPSLIWVDRVGNHYGDWLQVDATTSRPLLATAYFAHSADLVSRAAAALGRAEDADHYRALARRITSAFVDAFVAADGRIEGDTQTGYLLALAFHLVSGAQREAAAGHLVAAIERHGGLLTTGFVGVSLICPVLSDIGRDDLAFALLETDRYPSWLYSVRQGATTIWERWDGWTEHAGFQSAEMNSFNHYSLGSVGEWLYRYVAGIDQAHDSVAYEHVVIAPRVGGSLTQVEASYESMRGLISTQWRLNDGRFTLDVEIPPGSRATVVLPDGSSSETGSGRHRFETAL